MKNVDIIAETAIAAGLMTEKEIGEFFTAHGYLPFRTFAEWKKAGYSVKKGEHAKLTAWIWMPKKKSEKQKKAEAKALEAAGIKDAEKIEEESEEKNPDFVKVKAFLFGTEQVEKAERKAA